MKDQWILCTYKKLGGVGDLSRSTRLRLVLLPLLLLLELLRSTRFSRLLLLLLSRSLRGDRLRPLRLLPPLPPKPAPPTLLRFVGGGVEERSKDRDRDLEREGDLSRWGGVIERERLRLLDLKWELKVSFNNGLL